MKNKINKSLYLCIVLTLILGAGCRDKSVPVPGRVSQKPAAKAVEAPVVQKEEEKVERQSYVYDAKGRRDPFVSLIEAAKENRREGKVRRRWRITM